MIRKLPQYTFVHLRAFFAIWYFFHTFGTPLKIKDDFCVLWDYGFYYPVTILSSHRQNNKAKTAFSSLSKVLGNPSKLEKPNACSLSFALIFRSLFFCDI